MAEGNGDSAGGTGQPRVERYPLRNADAMEAARLGHLEALSDPFTIRWLEDLGVGQGWHCAELGAGKGSMVRHLSAVVGAGGSVTAVDRDTTQLEPLRRLGNVTVVEADLCSLVLPRSDYHLVHTRSVLMHLDAPEAAVRSAVAALRPGGVVFFEETDGSPAETVTDAPEPFRKVMVPITRRWTFAPRMTPLLETLGLTVVRNEVRPDVLTGATPRAAFWQHTLRSVAELRRAASADPSTVPDEEWIEQMIVLLDDPGFSVPYTIRHRVVAQRSAAA